MFPEGNIPVFETGGSAIPASGEKNYLVYFPKEAYLFLRPEVVQYRPLTKENKFPTSFAKGRGKTKTENQ